MKWTETREMAVARARLRNSIQNSLFQIALIAITFGLIPAVGIPVAAIIQHKNVMWEITFIFVSVCSVLGVVGHILRNWNRAIRIS